MGKSGRLGRETREGDSGPPVRSEEVGRRSGSLRERVRVRGSVSPVQSFAKNNCRHSSSLASPVGGDGSPRSHRRRNLHPSRPTPGLAELLLTASERYTPGSPGTPVERL